jgi:hypothetical protein
LGQSDELIYHLGTNCKQLISIDFSYNSFQTKSIKYLFNECLKLDEAFLINNNKNEATSSDFCQPSEDWLDVISVKFEDNNSQLPLKRLELKLTNNQYSEKNELKNLFRKKWHKSLIKIFHHSSNVIEFIVY